ncbi:MULTISPECIES: four-helix bundle copper-binding protein [Trichocoleus]|uniref:Four-helix bundle copper-binding protein n=1 Tax=Trichocoleus desertorum GB2-A4 TaxID=2933944 RepID=A0ABV0JG43_9CYAN|nr:four-helix bundle copper-binding protein [Trichocoleus sp. FACHB-46]MBD1865087.1 four-helix bundle copper-binding protein [Trichocoleus sp. FACHB-46]
MMTDSMNTELTELKVCIEVCTDCHNMCLEVMTYCSDRSCKYIDVSMMSMLRDCAEMTMMCINMIADGSEFAGRTCQLCAEMCFKCAIACDEMHDDKMTEYAAIFRKCAEHCKAIGLMSAAYFRRANLEVEAVS